MKGLSLTAMESIENLINSQFDSLSLQLLGLVPKLSKEKKIVFTTNKDSLAAMFLKALGTKQPNKTEAESMKVLLKIANGYVDALKSRTSSRVLNGIDAYIKDKNIKELPIVAEDIKEIMGKELGEAKKHFELIANSGAETTWNQATALQIAKIADERGIKDPTCAFVVTIDSSTGFYEFVLHLLPDGKTPRVWKLSEISGDYYVPGNQYPSIHGLHPKCFIGNKNIKVLTEKHGYKNIKDIKKGEKVLTHTGKFKKVLNTLEWYDNIYCGSRVKIQYKTAKQDGEKLITLIVTPEHMFLTQKGWTEAKDLGLKDKLTYLVTHNDKKEDKELRCISFKKISLTNIEFIEGSKRGSKLYDLTVEDDESFVVNGIVSHNCRCRISLVLPNWGWDQNGNITYIGKGHDEFEKQRSEYGLPNVPSKKKRKNGKWVIPK